ncbi:MAG: hypothetical protein IRY93_03350, partial [Chthoniobacterales bacterium]|nr:hypothetical protein [Chthoniobacterales bacterium]
MKSQTATGILASMVIGGIMGTLISYPINTIAERRSSAAWDELSNELESLAAEMEWFDRATKAQNFSSVVDIGDSALPLISRLDAKAKALRAKNPASEEAKKAETRLGDALCRAYAAQQQAELFARIRNNEP